MELHIRRDGTAYFNGMQTGKLSIADFMPGRNAIALKEAGSSYWASMGHQAYGGAQYWVLEITSKMTLDSISGILKMQVREIITIPIRLSESHTNEVLERLDRVREQIRLISLEEKE